MGPIMFWAFILLVYFILMSVFIALIAEAYEAAREQLNREQVQRMSRSPASGDKKIMVKTTRQGQLLLYNMSLKKMISRPLLYSLKAPLSHVEEALRQDSTGDLSSPGKFSVLHMIDAEELDCWERFKANWPAWCPGGKKKVAFRPGSFRSRAKSVVVANVFDQRRQNSLDKKIGELAEKPDIFNLDDTDHTHPIDT